MGKLEKAIRWTARIAGILMILLSFVSISFVDDEDAEEDIII